MKLKIKDILSDFKRVVNERADGSCNYNSLYDLPSDYYVYNQGTHLIFRCDGSWRRLVEYFRDKELTE